LAIDSEFGVAEPFEEKRVVINSDSHFIANIVAVQGVDAPLNTGKMQNEEREGMLAALGIIGG
jgi:hypothetical protein